MPQNFIKPLLILLWFPLLTLVAQDSLKSVVAEKGDGIYSLLRKQGVDPYITYDDFIVISFECNTMIRDKIISKCIALKGFLIE